MALKDITITGSIGSIPTQSYDQKTYISSTDEQSFPLETIVGGAGGSTPDLHGSISSSNLFVNITQSWSGSINTPVGIVAFVDQTQNEFINGQYSGSDILVTDGELSADNPYLKVSTVLTNYTPVYYYDIPNSISPNNRNDIPLNNFLDPNTSPDPGEIYIGASVSSIAGAFLTWQTYAIKIATIDNNGNYNTVALQELESFNITFSNGTNLSCDVTSIVDYTSQGYVMYWVKPSTKTLRAHQLDGKVLDYTVSASNSSSIIAKLDNFNTASFTTITTDNLGYITTFPNGTLGLYTPDNTPNTVLYITASLTASFGGTAPGGISIVEYPSYQNVMITGDNTLSGSMLWSASFTPIEGKSYALLFSGTPTNDVTVTNLQFLITQSQNVDTGSSDLTILSPYFKENFFYSDWNSLYGNADGLELDNNFMKVNYETGQAIPTNQEEILSGSAERAPVKPYNYALKAQTLPRYEGVRSTSPDFNQSSSEGGFGALPNVESLKIVAAYCDYIGSWAPEKNNSSAIHIIYLIDENGDIIAPNTTENSLETNKYSFISGERVLIKSNNISSGNPNPYRTIFRGGTRIEPILYTQIGVTPSQTWTSTIELEDQNNPGYVISDVHTAAYGGYHPQSAPYIQLNSQFIIPAQVQTQGNPSFLADVGSYDTTKVYIVPSEVLIDNLTLIFKAKIREIIYGLQIIQPIAQTLPTLTFDIWLRQDRLVGGIYQFYKDYPHFTDYVYSNQFDYTSISLSPGERNFSQILTSNDLQVNDRICWVIEFSSNVPSLPVQYVYQIDSDFIVEQSPISTPPTNVGINEIWGFFDKTNYPNVITSSIAVSSSLVSLYNNPNVRMKDISGSGFNTVVLPWSIKAFDEFRFEGVENNKYVVDKVYGPNDGLGTPYSASLNLTNIATEASTVGSSSFSLNGITFYYTGSNVTNISNTIYINTSSFSNSTISNYIVTSSNIFSYSSSIAPYSASIGYISISGSSPNLIFYYGFSNNLPTLISGSTIIPFGGGTQERFSPAGCIEVHFTENLPVSASSLVFNLDHFLIRRYIDDAAQIIIDGFAPIGSQAPYIVTPEFITPKLSKNIDKYITDLTQKGLL